MLVELCQTELNQTGNLFNNCSDNLITELNLVYNAASMLDNHRCTENALPLFCNTTCSDDNTLPQSEECVQVRDDNCAAEWRIVDNLLNGSSLDCATFKSETDLKLSFVPILCPDNFEVVCNSLCLPSCDLIPHSNGVTTAYRVWSSCFLILLLTGGVITLVACFLKRKKMLVVVYQFASCKHIIHHIRMYIRIYMFN